MVERVLVVSDFLKWKGFPDSDNTWVRRDTKAERSDDSSFFLQEPAENLECPDLIAAFMAEQKEKQATTSSSSTNKRTHSTNQKNDETSENGTSSPTKRARIEFEQTGYNRGLVPEMLMGATDIYDGELMFL